MTKKELYFATKKTANAHAYITKGIGEIRINNKPIEMIQHETAREVMLSPLEISGDLRNKINISIRVKGGGFMGQACSSSNSHIKSTSRFNKI